MKKLTIKKSTIKIDKEGFNSCPKRSELVKIIKDCKLQNNIVDVLELSYWENAEDTLVVKANEKEYLKMLYCIVSIARFYPDEINIFKEDKNIIVRFWWD